jgi:predicted transcriptional regulator
MRTGKDIQHVRHGMGMRLGEFADELGYNHSYVRQVEAGIAKVSKRFNNQIDTLLMKKKLEKMLQIT